MGLLSFLFRRNASQRQNIATSTDSYRIGGFVIGHVTIHMITLMLALAIPVFLETLDYTGV